MAKQLDKSVLSAPEIVDDYIWDPVKDFSEGEEEAEVEGDIITEKKDGKSLVIEGPEEDAEEGSGFLERSFNSISKGRDFNRFLTFAGKMAQSESFRGKKEFNEDSSASGLFHILTENGGGYSKGGAELVNGGYDKFGNRVKSSFDTAKSRLVNMMKARKGDEGNLKSEFIKRILDSKSPLELTREQQTMLMYADLKMRKGTEFEDFLGGKGDGHSIYSKYWVTGKGKHTKEGILENWENAGTRETDEGYDHYDNNRDFFGLERTGDLIKHMTRVYRGGGVIGGTDVDALKIIRGRSRMI